MSTHSSGSFGRTSRRDRAEKLQIEAEELYSRARAHSDSAAQLRREREGYEALRPSYRQLTPEQMGEYMAENVWGRNQAAGAEMAKSRELSRQAQTARSEAELEEELAFRIAYGDIPYREDYAEKSLPIPGGTKRGRPVLISSGARTGAYIDSGYDDIYYDIINGDADARNLEQSNDMALYGALQNHQYLYRLTDEERGIYNYLYQTDKAQAEKYLDGLTPYLYKRQAERETEDARASAEEDGLGASISSIVTKLDEGLSYLPQLGDVLAGNELDANAPYNRTVRRNSAIRETVANQWGPVGSFLYQTGMSMADFLFSMAASGGSAVLNLAILGTGAAAETVWSLKNAGLDDTRAFILGTAAGAAEIFTEQTSLETLLDPELLADGLKKYILKNMLAEGSEELASDLLNWAADDLYDWIAGEDKSEWKQKLRYCEALGIDPQTAAAQLIRERLTTAGLDMLGGALSGLFLSGANAAVNLSQDTQTDGTPTDVWEFLEPEIADSDEEVKWLRALGLVDEDGNTLENHPADDEISRVLDDTSKSHIMKLVDDEGIPRAWRRLEEATDDEILKGTNPQYTISLSEEKRGTDEDYTYNCTNCVVAYVLRRKGYNVTAKSVGECAALKSNNKLFTAWKGRLPTHASGDGLNDILEYLQDANDGTLVAITIKIPYSIFRPNMGHAFVAEKRNGRIFFLDPQSGIVYRNPKEIFGMVQEGQTLFMRIDDLEITDRGISACKEGA